MHGGVILFRGTGADARRYVEADRSRADDYYLGADASVAAFTALDGGGNVTAAVGLDPEAYAAWVDWVNPVTGESMGTPRLPGVGKQGSPRFAEMVVNAPKSLSIAAALHPEVSDVLDRAQQDAVAEIQAWLAEHSVTRVGPRGKQEVVPVQQLQTVAVSHRTSRAGDPHRHIHFQVGTRVWAAGKWRALDTAALFRQQGAIRALGTAVIAAHPELAEVLEGHGLTLDPVSGEVVELERFNGVMSKRGEQVRKHLERFEAEWEAAHPGETVGPVVSARLAAKAWAYERPAKKPTTLREEQAWATELREAGYDPETWRRPVRRAPVSLDDLSVQVVASRALDRCAAGSSAWTRHTVQEHATRIMTEYGVQAAPAEVREFVRIATALAMEDCFSILPPGAPAPEHVAHLTSLRVVQAETELRDLLTARVPKREPKHPDVRDAAKARGLDAGQERAAAAVASRDPLVVVEGAAGAGKTTMLGVAIEVAAQHGRVSRVVAPTLRAAQVARDELDVPASSVAALVHAHGWRWNSDGVWTRLAPGDTDPETGRTYRGPSEDERLARGERVIVDEAGMLDQDTAIALLTVCDEAGATVALVGDRAQLAAVGRGGVLDVAAQFRGHTFDMAEVHRFTDPAYAEVTLRMRDGRNPGEVFDQLARLGLIRLHDSGEEAREHIAQARQDGEAITVSTNDEARTVNARIREERVSHGAVDDTTTVYGNDGLPIGAGDVIQTRKNNTDVGVANRQQWVVQHVEDDGALSVREAGNGRKRQRTLRLPADYVAEHAHLSYASTAYGAQGATVAGSHTILTDATSAAGVYVGMTRGRESNVLHVVAESQADARAQFIEAMERDRADRGLADATRRAVEEVAGLTENGPVRFVNDEMAALDKRAATAEAQAARWQQVSAALADLSDRETEVRERARAAEQSARERAEQVRAEVAAPVVSAARGALADWQQADAAEQEASEQVPASSWFGKRRARDEHENAQARTAEARQQVTSEWGEPPRSNERADAWVERVTRPRIDSDPRVIDAEQEHQAARDALLHRPERAQTERLVAFARVFGAETVIRNQQAYLTTNPMQQATRAANTARQAREEAALLRTLTPAEAVARIEQTRAEQAASEAQRVEQERARPYNFPQKDRSTPERDGFGLSR
ncbi:AAA family ATPase [Micrococcus lylae]|uniref:TrwC relaxase n=1 Tax=Micrococcus lylae TaxID=1273 RepID=A0ABY2JXG5_9MICC|nr:MULTISPECIES: MobF family relaxase [Micrococcus]MCT2007607.1 AAA family ATPase [Micrococcus lylae]MCT2071360.1 AAA family ATPase [Micrococcus lylae]OFR90393.1 TrwC relaxase [Micrococcus sp. HMSC067E09]TFH98142.1 TrwC relaxase [Micrococcus lylae]